LCTMTSCIFKGPASVEDDDDDDAGDAARLTNDSL
jgi:hypothetical protein